MFQKWLVALAAAFCLAPVGSAGANEILSANLNASCSGYTVAVTGDHLAQKHDYAVKWEFQVEYPDGSLKRFHGHIPIQSMDSNGDFNKSKTYVWKPLLDAGSYAFMSGHATLFRTKPTKLKANTVAISFNPTNFSCTGLCECNSTNNSNFNGTQIPSGDYIWFNSNFSASGIPSAGTTLYFTNSTVTFTAGGTQYTVPVPNGQVTFSTSVTCTTTTYDSTTNTWFTTVPVKGDDEILMQDVAWLVPSGFGKVTGNVVWNTTMSTNDSGVTANWKWGAAVYSEFTTDYNQLMVKPAHQSACAYGNGDHAGTPEGENSAGEPWKHFVVGGGRGGGGSNFTGSWSGTVNASIACPMHH